MTLQQSDIGVFITCSDDVARLQRCVEKAKVSLDNVHVNINTLDNEFKSQASTYLDSVSIPYKVTESNGTPSKGKNATLDYFKELDYTYMLPVDGDDYLGKDAFNLINNLVVRHDPQVAIFQSGPMVENEEDGMEGGDFMSESFNKTYRCNLEMMHRITQSFQHSGDAQTRCVLYHKVPIENNIIRCDENITWWEDYNLILKLKHYWNTEKLRLVQFFTDAEFYYYDLFGGKGSHQQGVEKKPEDFSQIMLEWSKSIEGLSTDDNQFNLPKYITI